MNSGKEEHMENKHEDIVYSRLASRVGHHIALFCLCAVSDVLYDPEIEANSWSEYKEIAKGDFEGGETDINAAILAGMDRQDRWETIWGDGYSESDYKQLDDLYRTMTAQLDATGGIDRQQEDAARTCARMATFWAASSPVISSSAALPPPVTV